MAICLLSWEPRAPFTNGVFYSVGLKGSDSQVPQPSPVLRVDEAQEVRSLSVFPLTSEVLVPINWSSEFGCVGRGVVEDLPSEIQKPGNFCFFHLFSFCPCSCPSVLPEELSKACASA